MTAHNYGRVSPFGHPRINALLATPRGLSRPYTSFIGLLCQGIHRVPLTKTHNKHGHLQKILFNNQMQPKGHTTTIANKRRYSRPLYSSQTTRNTQTPTTTGGHHSRIPNRKNHEGYSRHPTMQQTKHKKQIPYPHPLTRASPT